MLEGLPGVNYGGKNKSFSLPVASTFGKLNNVKKKMKSIWLTKKLFKLNVSLYYTILKFNKIVLLLNEQFINTVIK